MIDVATVSQRLTGSRTAMVLTTCFAISSLLCSIFMATFSDQRIAVTGSIAAFGVVCGVWLVCFYLPVLGALEEKEEAQRDTILYNRFLIFLGVLLLSLGLMEGSAILGLMNKGVLPARFDIVGSQASDPTVAVKYSLAVVGLALVMSLLGSVFFTANSLLSLRKNCVAFDVNEFWGGFWLRMGTSLLFTLVFFVFSCSAKNFQDAMLPRLPIIGLFCGMFIKSGERVIAGLAERVFAGFEGLLPNVGVTDDKPSIVRNATLSETVDGVAVFKWDEPLSGGAPMGYRIYDITGGESKAFVVTESHVSVREVSLGAIKYKRGDSYAIRAWNKAGEGPFGETLTVPIAA